MLCGIVGLLPIPEHLVDEAVMEGEDGIKARRLILPHVTVG